MSESERWNDLLLRLGGKTDSEAVFITLSNHYSERHRAYHTMTHIRECLTQFDKVAAMAGNPDQIEVALWFHDAIYDPMSSRNEAKSAELAYRFLCDLGISSPFAKRIKNLILATKHDKTQTDGDERLIADIDLSILASESERFEEYETQIRQEYRLVPEFLYRKGRSEILRSFMKRDRIFQTDFFRSRYETTARENITRLLDRLCEK